MNVLKYGQLTTAGSCFGCECGDGIPLLLGAGADEFKWDAGLQVTLKPK